MKKSLSHHWSLALLAPLLFCGLFTGCRDRSFVHQGVCFEPSTGGLHVMALPDGRFYSGDVNIPDSVPFEGDMLAVVAIAEGAFDGCTDLHSLVIPATVVKFGTGAFNGCTSLRGLHLRHVTPPLADSTDFAGVPMQSCNLYVPLQSLPAYAADVVWKQFSVFEEGAVASDAAPVQHVAPIVSDDHGE